MTPAATLRAPDPTQYHGHPVRLESFEGPLDLLLHLIRKDQIEIWEISVARITRQYLEYLAEMRALNIEVAGDFLVMAATLMRIKSQNLLPRPSVTDDEDEEEPMTREALIERLIEYRKYREAARTLARMEGEQAKRHPRGAPQRLDPGFKLPLREPNVVHLADYLRDLLDHRDPEPGHRVVLEEYRLEEQIEWVRSVLEDPSWREKLPGDSGEGIRFHSILRRPGTALETVVTFLAILELARLQHLWILQAGMSEEIWLRGRAAEFRTLGLDSGDHPEGAVPAGISEGSADD